MRPARSGRVGGVGRLPVDRGPDGRAAKPLSFAFSKDNDEPQVAERILRTPPGPERLSRVELAVDVRGHRCDECRCGEGDCAEFVEEFSHKRLLQKNTVSIIKAHHNSMCMTW